MKDSIVPIFGSIIPEPLAIAPIVTLVPLTKNSAAHSFLTVSVVIIASAAFEPLSDNSSIKVGIPFFIASAFIGTPITPVEAISTSSFGIFNFSAKVFAISLALSIPSWPVQQLALPLLHIIACAFLSFKCSFVTYIGAHFTLLFVYIPAPMHGTLEYTRAKSFFVVPSLTPQCIPEAKNPFGAVTLLFNTV